MVTRDLKFISILKLIRKACTCSTQLNNEYNIARTGQEGARTRDQATCSTGHLGGDCFNSSLPEDACAEKYGKDDRSVAKNDKVADGDHLEGHVARQNHDSIGSTIYGDEEA